MTILETQALIGCFVFFSAVFILMPFIFRSKRNREEIENEKIRKGIK